MLPAELERLAARHVPGTGEVEIKLVGCGSVNDTYRVRRAGRAHALRAPADNAPPFEGDRAWEWRVLKNAGLAGIAPVVEYCDPARGILVTRWVDGVRWSPADTRRPAHVSRMASLLRRVHALPLPWPPRRVAPADWIERYSAARGSAAAARQSAAERRTAAALRDEAGARVAELAALPAVAPVLCHSDLHALNVIDRGPSLVLLDWEYAHASEPLWDLAGWSANNDLEEASRRELLCSYLERTATDDEYARLGSLIWLYDYVCWLWSALHSQPGPRAAAAETRAAAAETRAAAGEAHAAQLEIAARARLLEARLTAGAVRS